MAFLLIAGATWLSVLVLALALCRAAAVGDLAPQPAPPSEETFVAALADEDELPAEAPPAPARRRIAS